MLSRLHRPKGVLDLGGGECARVVGPLDSSIANLLDAPLQELTGLSRVIPDNTAHIEANKGSVCLKGGYRKRRLALEILPADLYYCSELSNAGLRRLKQLPGQRIKDYINSLAVRYIHNARQEGRVAQVKDPRR